MGDASDLSLEDFMVAKRQQQNSAGENLDKNGLLKYFEGVAADYDKFRELPNWKLSKEVCASAVAKVVPDTSARILDCGTGTGQTAEELFALGYKNVDGLDMSMSMLEVAKAKGILQNIICDSVDGNHQTDIPTDTYDAIICTGTFAPGQMDQGSFPELTRITKSGGYILFNISFKYLEEWKLFKDGAIDADIQRNIDAGIWKSVAKDNIPYWKDESCLLYTITTV